MKLLRLVSLALATAAILPSVTSCKSDPNPFDFTITPAAEENESAYVRLNLRVENTRAGVPALASEKVIKKVNIFVFDKQLGLQESVTNYTLGEGENSVVLKVSHGIKTIYAIAGYDIDPEDPDIDYVSGMSLANFENLTFTSTLDKLKTESGHVLIGKSNEQQVMISAREAEMPESNKFSIELVSVMAKAQVKVADFDGSSFGISFGGVSFKAKQTCDKMMVVHNGSDIFSTFEVSNNGTYNGYSSRVNDAYKNAVTTGFTGVDCEYMPENIIANPLSGNTTFLSIKIATTPTKFYSFAATDSAPKVISNVNPAGGTTYYVVGVVDRTHGISDYAVDMDSHVITFKDEEDALNYASVLNTGKVSFMTVSQTESQMKAPSTRAEESASTEFEVFTFDEGAAYYRVNIAHTEDIDGTSKTTNKVMRNKFYKISINSVNSLGFSEESLLCPTNPASSLNVVGSSWISASFDVADWDPVDQDVNL